MNLYTPSPISDDSGEAAGPPSRNQPEAIRRFLLDHIPDHPRDAVALATQEFNVDRTTVYRHIRKLMAEKAIIQTGNTSGARYYLKSALNKQVSLDVLPKMEEVHVWMDYLNLTLSLLSENLTEILRYGFSRIFQNVVDHSDAKQVDIRTEWGRDELTLDIIDHGVGIFNRLTSVLGLQDERECVARLAEGKVTTDSENHAGQGLFFTARAVDRFHLWSGHLHYHRTHAEDDWTLERSEDCLAGTGVAISIRYDTPRKISEVFAKCSTLDEESDPHFDQVQVTVAMGSTLPIRKADRSQAKKLLQGIDKYRYVLVDFNNVNTVTQGFVDEVFRLFQARHPDIRMEYTNANEDIEFMIEHTLPESVSRPKKGTVT